MITHNHGRLRVATYNGLLMIINPYWMWLGHLWSPMVAFTHYQNVISRIVTVLWPKKNVISWKFLIKRRGEPTERYIIVFIYEPWRLMLYYSGLEWGHTTCLYSQESIFCCFRRFSTAKDHWQLVSWKTLCVLFLFHSWLQKLPRFTGPGQHWWCSDWLSGPAGTWCDVTFIDYPASHRTTF